MIGFKVNAKEKDKIASNGYIKLKKLSSHKINFGTTDKPVWREVHHIMKEE